MFRLALAFWLFNLVLKTGLGIKTKLILTIVYTIHLILELRIAYLERKLKN